ncbi:MAG: lipocalin-like domain-containing protein [Wenzhouxiangellaceae bacterium]
MVLVWRWGGCLLLLLPLLTVAAPERSRLDVAGILGADSSEYPQPQPGYTLQFPRDHGAHPDYRHEWWYLTGNLRMADGRHLGYQFTLFRYALSPQSPTGASAWNSHQIYMAHAAISLPDEQRFLHQERFSRGALGLAGVSLQPFRVWLYDWALNGIGDSAEPPWQLRFTVDDVELELTLEADKPRVLQGDRGYSAKGGEAASHYFSYTRLNSSGALSVDGQTTAVSGASWYDREWGSAGLDQAQVGWDWFALQLADGRDLMWYQLRKRDGGIEPASAGVLVDPTGDKVRHLSSADLQVQVRDWWQAPDGSCYPAAWRLILDQSETLAVRPIMADQWWNKTMRYWEGAVDVGQGKNGYGYVELTGYPPKPSCPE